MSNGDVDVVVIGAGLAGLSAARDLVKGGASAVVIEARDRVGGRTVSADFDGQRIDLGGQWLGPNQRRMAALVKELGLATFPTYSHGRKILLTGGELSTYEGTIPSLSPVHLIVLQATLMRLERMYKAIPADHPYEARRAGELDALTAEAWAARNVPSRKVRDLLAAAARVIYGAELSELSLLHFLHYASSGGGLMKLVEIEGGAQQDRFVNGAGEVSQRLAAALGERVLLNKPVERVVQDGEGVTVTGPRATIRARYAIVAVPPALAGRIHYDPLLPAIKDGLFQRFSMGATLKCFFSYEEPFWRREGLSGEAVSTEGPLTVTFDNSPHDGARGMLLGFAVGQSARRLSEEGPEERRRAVTAAMQKLFGARAREPRAYVDQDWSAEAWTRGCPTGTMGPGTMTLFGPSLRTPVGRLHWAGTETAIEHTGYMEGAVESGERAAGEVLKRL